VPAPGTVRVALALSWSALAIAIFASIAYYASGAALAFGDIALHVLGYAITALLLAGIGAGNPWSRILFALFLGWNLGLAAFNLAIGSAQLPVPYRLDLLILGMQALGTLLLFLPASQPWFRRATSAP
jgi:hypothetical protein